MKVLGLKKTNNLNLSLVFSDSFFPTTEKCWLKWRRRKKDEVKLRTHVVTIKIRLKQEQSVTPLSPNLIELGLSLSFLRYLMHTDKLRERERIDAANIVLHYFSLSLRLRIDCYTVQTFTHTHTHTHTHTS